MPRYRFTAFARKGYGEAGWSIRVEGFPGTVEESPTASVADAACMHVAHNLRVPIDDVTVDVNYLSPQAIPTQASARSRYGTDLHVTRRAFGGTTALAAVDEMRSWLTEETADSVRLLCITVQYDPDEVDGAAPVELAVLYERFFYPVADARILADPVIAVLTLNGLRARLTDASDEEEAAIAIDGYDDHLFAVAPADGERAWATLWRDEHDPEFTDVESTLDGLGLQSSHGEIAEAIMRQLAGHPPPVYTSRPHADNGHTVKGHSVAVLRRAATLAPTVLPAALAEIAADEIGIELDALDAGAARDSIDERVLRIAQEILSLLPANYAARVRSEVQNAGWRPWSMEVAADLLNLITTWEDQGPGPEAAVLLAQVRELVQHPSARASPSGESHARGRGCPQE